ncbi:TolC family protein [Calycomorphotria hydatis]|uniref:Outer membrane efflux protein n=1 Tax=Calycomorphotria hydatis TaxID=2528027 RepID=A0A517TBU6_9PLAN|nr:TolC family protein [Calycomorphotria hydatis]QDT65840.1 Outer membrane efflux protein [Calycomorphotria hydatis]
MQRWARMALGASFLMGAIIGCTSTEPKVHYIGKAKLKYYEDAEMDLAYPAHVEGDPTLALSSEMPRTVRDRRHDEIWDLTLADAIRIALENNDVIRTVSASRGQVGTFGLNTTALISGNNTPSVYDPAIQNTNVLNGARGVEAALADFDATFSTSMVWGRQERLLNNSFVAGLAGSPTPFELVTETGAFRSAITKQTATGGTITVSHDWDYEGNNTFSPAQIFPSVYEGNVALSLRQPVLAGGGVDYTRVAGPIGTTPTPVAAVNQGVVIARINNDITLTDFEINSRDLLKSVEDTYWNLYLTYRNYKTALEQRNSALRSWRESKARLDIGGVRGFRPADEAQARDFYFETRATVETVLNSLYSTEGELRRLLGLPVNDGRIIRPIDEPSTAEFMPDWPASVAESLMFRPELRQLKWEIQSLDLQRRAAMNLTRPRLDAVAGYQVNGFGDDLINKSQTGPYDDAYATLLRNDQTQWSLGFEFSVPIGLRQAHSQVRNIELQLMKARRVLSVAELDVSHEVADAMQQIALRYQTAQSNFNRRIAAKRRTELFEEEYKAGTVTLDEVLRAQSSLAQAESAYFTSLVNYNQAIAQLQFAKGTLLDWNNVRLAEGGWTPRAYQQALRKAWERSHGIHNPLLKDAPPPFAIPDDSRVLVMPDGRESGAMDVMPLPPSPLPADEINGTISDGEAKTLEDMQKSSPTLAPPAPPASEGLEARATSPEVRPPSLDKEWGVDDFLMPTKSATSVATNTAPKRDREVAPVGHLVNRRSVQATDVSEMIRPTDQFQMPMTRDAAPAAPVANRIEWPAGETDTGVKSVGFEQPASTGVIKFTTHEWQSDSAK